MVMVPKLCSSRYSLEDTEKSGENDNMEILQADLGRRRKKVVVLGGVRHKVRGPPPGSFLLRIPYMEIIDHIRE